MSVGLFTSLEGRNHLSRSETCSDFPSESGGVAPTGAHRCCVHCLGASPSKLAPTTHLELSVLGRDVSADSRLALRDSIYWILRQPFRRMRTLFSHTQIACD
ncbi:hypothetical protein Q8A73_002790 [Channa argus]|nr:hypothetical protein Q8A73_002790 [Channa argus]